jgi:antitoxin ParD1/3/4
VWIGCHLSPTIKRKTARLLQHFARARKGPPILGLTGFGLMDGGGEDVIDARILAHARQALEIDKKLTRLTRAQLRNALNPQDSKVTEACGAYVAEFGEVRRYAVSFSFHESWRSVKSSHGQFLDICHTILHNVSIMKVPIRNPDSMSINVRVGGALKRHFEVTTREGDFETVSEYVRDLIRRDKAAQEELAFETVKAHLQTAFAVPESEYKLVSADDIRSLAKARCK